MTFMLSAAIERDSAPGLSGQPMQVNLGGFSEDIRATTLSDKILTTRNNAKELARLQKRREFGRRTGIVFPRLFAARFALRGAMSRWVAMRDT